MFTTVKQKVLRFHEFHKLHKCSNFAKVSCHGIIQSHLSQNKLSKFTKTSCYENDSHLLFVKVSWCEIFWFYINFVFISYTLVMFCFSNPSQAAQQTSTIPVKVHQKMITMVWHLLKNYPLVNINQPSTIIQRYLYSILIFSSSSCGMHII